MDWRTFFKGEYIAAVEFGGKTPTLTIAKVMQVAMEDEKTKKQVDKCVIHFCETKRGWVINKTNAICIAGMFGNEVEGWAGKRVTLHAPLVQLGAEKVLGIRVKGSPDITAPIQVVLKLPRKKPTKVTMQPTGSAKGSAAPASEADFASELEAEAVEETADALTGAAEA